MYVPVFFKFNEGASSPSIKNLKSSPESSLCWTVTLNVCLGAVADNPVYVMISLSILIKP